jgi:mercuric ion transport protein
MDRSIFERFGTVGAVVAAAACPICFPKVALVGAAVGFGAFAPFEGYIAVGVQILFVLSLVGQVLAFPRHRNRWLLALSAATTVLLFAAYYLFLSSMLLQVSLAGLVAASIWLVVESRRCAKCEAQAQGAKADA